MDVVGWRSCVCGGENWLLIVLVLSGFLMVDYYYLEFYRSCYSNRMRFK